jgi:hypothetical protein
MIRMLDLRDRRGTWQLVGPDIGLTLRQAMLCYDEEDRAEQFLDLEAEGYAGDPPMLYGLDGEPTPREVLSLFRVRSGQLRELRSRLEFCLTRKLATGVLTAIGYAAGDPLDEPARAIPPDRWRLLTPDFETSQASGPGVLVTGILVFGRPANGVRTPQPRRCSNTAATTWYRKWIAENVAAGTRPNRKQDAEAARAAGISVSRERLRGLRRELAPPEWTSHGRRPSGS